MADATTEVPLAVRGTVHRVKIPTAQLPKRVACFIRKFGGATRRYPSMPLQAALELAEPVRRGRGFYLRLTIDPSVEPFRSALNAHIKDGKDGKDGKEPDDAPAPPATSARVGLANLREES